MINSSISFSRPINCSEVFNNEPDLIKQYYALSLYCSSLPFNHIINYSGEAEAILAKAQATAKGIAIVSEYIKKSGGVEVSFFTWIVMWLHWDLKSHRKERDSLD